MTRSSDPATGNKPFGGRVLRRYLPILAAASVLLLAACGQRGPLYLPHSLAAHTPTPPDSTPAVTEEKRSRDFFVSARSLPAL